MPRAFVPRVLSCTSIAKRLLRTSSTARLFGHEKGAFPGAFTSRDWQAGPVGRWNVDPRRSRSAPSSHSRTARSVLATGEVRPVGLNGSYSVDVRLIATSSRPLPKDFHPGLAERIGATTVVPPAATRAKRRHSSACAAPSQRFAEQASLKPAFDRQRRSCDPDALRLARQRSPARRSPVPSSSPMR